MTGSDERRLAGPNPYIGPRPFEVDETLYGRAREINELYYLLSAERIVLLHSPSGAGKSSLGQAGLLGRLRGRFDVWSPARVNQQPTLRQNGGSPVNRYVLSALQGFEEGIPEKLRRPVEELASQTLTQYVEARPKRPGAPESVALIFDQFEEILTVDPLALAAKAAFFDQLGELLRHPRVWALFVLREDYLAPLDPYAQRVPTHLKNRFRIDLLGLEAAGEAMVEPARAGGRAFPAVEKLVHDLATMQVQQPDGSFRKETGNHIEPVQLQVVCRRLWDAMPADDLSIDPENLAEFGDVGQALAAYYTDAVGKASGGELAREREIREWFNDRLITADGIRSQVLRGVDASEGLSNDLIEQLRETHLIRAETRAGATWYELAHDRLIQPVRENNAAWQDTHLSDLQRQAALWAKQARPDGLLLRDEALVEAERWAEAQADPLTPDERDFLDKCRESRDLVEREQRQARRIRWLAVGATIFSVIAVVASIFAFLKMGEAEENEKKAIQQTERARRSLYNAQLGRAITVAQRYPARAFALFHDIERCPIDLRDFTWRHYVHLSKQDRITIRGHTGPVSGVAFAPDGRTLASASFDNTVKLWDAASGALRTTLKHTRGVVGVAFAPDGRTLASAGGDKTVKLWDVDSGEPNEREDPPKQGD